MRLSRRSRVPAWTLAVCAIDAVACGNFLAVGGDTVVDDVDSGDVLVDGGVIADSGVLVDGDAPVLDAADASSVDAGQDASWTCEPTPLVPRCAADQSAGCGWDRGCCVRATATSNDGLVQLPLGAEGLVLTSTSSDAAVYWIGLHDLMQDDFRLRFDLAVAPQVTGFVADGFAVSFLRSLTPEGAEGTLPTMGNQTGSKLGVLGVPGVCGGAGYVSTFHNSSTPGLELGSVVLPSGTRKPALDVTPTFESSDGVHVRLMIEHERAQDEPQTVFAPCADAGVAGTAKLTVTLLRCTEDCEHVATTELKVPADASLLGISASTGTYYSTQYLERVGSCRRGP